MALRSPFLRTWPTPMWAGCDRNPERAKEWKSILEAPHDEHGGEMETSVMLGATKPEKTPCSSRSAKSCQGLRAKAMAPTKTVIASIERSTISRRPKRSPSAPQIGLMNAADSGAAPKTTPVQAATAPGSLTPRLSR